MGNLTPEQKTHISMVFAIAISDGDYDENEMEWIANIAYRYGLSYEEYQEAHHAPGVEMLETIRNLSSAMREQIMKDCIVCAIADGKLEDSEMKFLGSTAAVLGYSMEDVLRMHDAMRDEVLNS